MAIGVFLETKKAGESSGLWEMVEAARIEPASADHPTCTRGTSITTSPKRLNRLALATVYTPRYRRGHALAPLDAQRAGAAGVRGRRRRLAPSRGAAPRRIDAVRRACGRDPPARNGRVMRDRGRTLVVGQLACVYGLPVYVDGQQSRRRSGCGPSRTARNPRPATPRSSRA
jgi:hypothetical protein